MEELLQDIEQWVQDGVSITVQLRLLTVDSSCEVGISSFTETECISNADTEQPQATVVIRTIIGAAAGVGALLILVIMVVTVVIIMRRNRCGAQKMELNAPAP